MSKQEHSKPAAAPTAEPILKLTLEQELAASLWETSDRKKIAAAVGVSPAVINKWQQQPLYIAEIATFQMGEMCGTEEKQAAALIFGNISFAEAEALIGLEAGPIADWAQTEGSSFNELLECMKQLLSNELSVDAGPYGLTDDQIRAIPLIVEGNTDAEVAKAIGKTRETVNRWRNHDEDFKRELKAARNVYHDAQIAAVSARAQKAIDVLDELLDSDDERIRLQAVSLLLKSAPSLKKEDRKIKNVRLNKSDNYNSYMSDL